MITIKAKGDFRKTDTFLQRLLKVVKLSDLDKYGKRGVELLSAATPKDTGKTAESWDYRIERRDGKTKIVWFNSNIQNGVNIAIILQYGHGTRTGGYVEGVDYVNPAMRPLFEDIANQALEEIKRL